ncbi:MAG TPA: hypothetical protein PLR25_19870 [Planctomycetaceae bacterium]|nr:hypothetical protein [Planctomycetaceae bacterium]
MALDNAQLVEFCNDELRQIADKFVALKIRVDAAYEEYNARNLGTIINDGGSSGPVLDGSASDGRTIGTGGDVFNMVTLMADFQTFMTSGRVDVVYKWQVNGNRQP